MKKKILAGVLACVLLIGVGVGGTLAWLTAQTTAVTNTFTVGDINLTLDEVDVDKDSVATDNVTVNGVVRDMANAYKVIPGETITKDPTVHVQKGSEKCYVYVLIDDQMNETIDGCASYTVDSSKWTFIKDDDNGKAMYKYSTEVDASSKQQDLLVFDGVKISGKKVTKSDITTLANKTITVKAYAHQSEHLDDSVDMDANAWAALNG